MSYASLLRAWSPHACACLCSSDVSAVDLLSFPEFMSLLHRIAARMPEDSASRWDRPVMCPLSLVKRLFRHLDFSSGLKTLLRSSRTPLVSAGRLRKYVGGRRRCHRVVSVGVFARGYDVSHAHDAVAGTCRGFVTQNGNGRGGK